MFPFQRGKQTAFTCDGAEATVRIYEYNDNLLSYHKTLVLERHLRTDHTCCWTREVKEASSRFRRPLDLQTIAAVHTNPIIPQAATVAALVPLDSWRPFIGLNKGLSSRSWYPVVGRFGAKCCFVTSINCRLCKSSQQYSLRLFKVRGGRQREACITPLFGTQQSSSVLLAWQGRYLDIVDTPVTQVSVSIRFSAPTKPTTAQKGTPAWSKVPHAA